MKNILLTICTLIGSVLCAQNPGYMGKHWMVYAVTDFAAVLSGDNGSWVLDEYESYAGVSLNRTQFRVGLYPGIGTEYTISKSVTMGNSVRYMVLYNALDFYESYTNSTNELRPLYAGETRGQSIMYSGYLKFHPFKNRGVIAPIGRYHQFELITGKLKISNGDYYTTDPVLIEFLAEQTTYSNFNYTDYTIESDISELGFGDINYAYLRYSFGGQTVVYDRYPIDLCMYITFPANLLANTNVRSSFYDAHYGEMLNTLTLGFTFRIGFFVL